MNTKEKEALKLLISFTTNYLDSISKHQLHMHFIDLYHSSLSNLLSFLMLFYSNVKKLGFIPPASTLKSSTSELLIFIEKQLAAAEITVKKLEKTGFFDSFGLNYRNRDLIQSLYSNYNEIFFLIEQNNYLGLKFELLELKEKDIESKMVFIDEEIKKVQLILENSENYIKFNTSLKHLQNDLSLIFFIRCVEKSRTPAKKLFKQYEFLQYFAKFLKIFERHLDLNEEQMVIIQKKMKVREIIGSLSATKICVFFNEIWGNINEKTKIIGMKPELDNKESDDISLFLFEKKGGFIENEDLFVEEIKNEIDFFENKPEKMKNKENCHIF